MPGAYDPGASPFSRPFAGEGSLFMLKVVGDSHNPAYSPIIDDAKILGKVAAVLRRV